MDHLIRCRKNVKWTPFMLSEHNVMLKEWEQSQEHVQPPQLQEDRLTEIAEILTLAWMNESTVKVTFWENQQYHEVFGQVKRFDTLQKSICIKVANREENQSILAIRIWDVVIAD